MSRFGSVEAFANKISKEENTLDIAILNAGTVAPSFQLTPDGYETILQVNVLSTALLAVLLHPMLQKSAKISGQPSHLEFVGSIAHHSVNSSTFNQSNNIRIIDQVNKKSFFGIKVQYDVSKLFLMYIMEALVQEIKGSQDHRSPDVIITTVCPCLCKTNLGRDFASPLKVINWLFQYPFVRTAEEGSRTLVSGVTLGTEAHGEFWSHDVLFK